MQCLSLDSDSICPPHLSVQSRVPGCQHTPPLLDTPDNTWPYRPPNDMLFSTVYPSFQLPCTYTQPGAPFRCHVDPPPVMGRGGVLMGLPASGLSCPLRCAEPPVQPLTRSFCPEQGPLTASHPTLQTSFSSFPGRLTLLGSHPSRPHFAPGLMRASGVSAHSDPCV